MFYQRIKSLWQNLRLNTKLGISFGVVLGLIIMVACSGYLMLIIVQNKTKTSMQTSMKIQHRVLEIKAGIETARKMQKDFFMDWSNPEYSKEMIIASRNVAGKIQEIKELSLNLQELIANSGFVSHLDKSRLKLGFFLSVADRFFASFHEATTLRISLMKLEKELKQLEQKLFSKLQTIEDPEIIALFWQMQSYKNVYLRTRSRPNMQTSFNIARELHQKVLNRKKLKQADKKVIIQILDSFVETAAKILPLDVNLKSKFNEFDLQVEAVDPIIEDLISIADQEMTVSKEQIANITWIAVVLLFLALIAAIMLAMLIAVLLNKSITQNVLKLTYKAKELRQGNLGARMEIENSDELGQLAESFNTMAEQIQKQVNELENLARTDQLTGISNRHNLLQCLDFELRRVRRTNTPMSVIMFDIDHFKRINDTYGHGIGDKILQELVNIVGNNLREMDVLARWGGEEFLILAPDSDLQSAYNLAERLRKIVAVQNFTTVGNITVSFGVTQYQEGDTVDGLISRADRYMYMAKQMGRNTVKFSL